MRPALDAPGATQAEVEDALTHGRSLAGRRIRKLHFRAPDVSVRPVPARRLPGLVPGRWYSGDLAQGGRTQPLAVEDWARQSRPGLGPRGNVPACGPGPDRRGSRRGRSAGFLSEARNEAERRGLNRVGMLLLHSSPAPAEDKLLARHWPGVG